MRFYIPFLAIAFGLVVCLHLAADTTAPDSASSAGSDADQASSPNFSESQIIETWGWILARQAKVDHSEISDAELPDFLKGVAEGFKATPCPYFYTQIRPDVDILAKARREKFVSTVIARNQAIASDMCAELDKNPNVVKLSAGLRYQILKAGDGPSAKPQQTVNVHFIGHLLNGNEIMQTGPIDLVLWPNQLNKYVYEGLQHMNKGAVMRLYVTTPPSDFEIEMYNIQPGSVIVYEVELLDIKESTPDALQTALPPDAPAPPTPPPSGYSQQQIMETWGWNVARRAPVSQLGFTDEQTALLTKGLMEGINGQPAPHDLDKIEPDVDKFIADERDKAQEAFKEKQLADMQAFFADLKKNKNVVELPSGLCYEIIKPGVGPCPAPGKTVNIFFVGRLLNGKIFEQTVGGDTRRVELDNPPGPWPFPGWYEGLQKINKGGKIRLYIPPSLGFGPDAFNGAPPYSTLIYDIEMVDIQDTPPPDDSSAATQPTTQP
jgi:FKBP-type peptidyl-prolyl cis-trans isomerase